MSLLVTLARTKGSERATSKTTRDDACLDVCMLPARRGEGERRERGRGWVRRKGVDVGLIPKFIPPSEFELGCRLPLMKGSSSLVEWSWGIVGDVGWGRGVVEQKNCCIKI